MTSNPNLLEKTGLLNCCSGVGILKNGGSLFEKNKVRTKKNIFDHSKFSLL